MTTSPALNTVGWFQIGTPDPAATSSFYSELFGWNIPADDSGYQAVFYAGAEAPSGGIADTSGRQFDHAIFMVLVADVPATLAAAQRLGGKELAPPFTTPSGVTFAHLQDATGNHFGVYSAPAA